MYPSYLEDTKEQLKETCYKAIEGDQTHLKLQSGTVNVSAVGNQLFTQPIIFPMPFTPNMIPDVMVCLTFIGNTSSTIKYLVGSSPNDKGFTLQLLTDTTQNLLVTWYAKGKAE